MSNPDYVERRIPPGGNDPVSRFNQRVREHGERRYRQGWTTEQIRNEMKNLTIGVDLISLIRPRLNNRFSKKRKYIDKQSIENLLEMNVRVTLIRDYTNWNDLVEQSVPMKLSAVINQTLIASWSFSGDYADAKMVSFRKVLQNPLCNLELDTVTDFSVTGVENEPRRMRAFTYILLHELNDEDWVCEGTTYNAWSHFDFLKLYRYSRVAFQWDNVNNRIDSVLLSRPYCFLEVKTAFEGDKCLVGDVCDGTSMSGTLKLLIDAGLIANEFGNPTLKQPLSKVHSGVNEIGCCCRILTLMKQDHVSHIPRNYVHAILYTIRCGLNIFDENTTTMDFPTLSHLVSCLEASVIPTLNEVEGEFKMLELALFLPARLTLLWREDEVKVAFLAVNGVPCKVALCFEDWPFLIWLICKFKCKMSVGVSTTKLSRQYMTCPGLVVNGDFIAEVTGAQASCEALDRAFKDCKEYSILYCWKNIWDLENHQEILDEIKRVEKMDQDLAESLVEDAYGESSRTCV